MATCSGHDQGEYPPTGLLKQLEPHLPEVLAAVLLIKFGSAGQETLQIIPIGRYTQQVTERNLPIHLLGG